MPGPYQTGARLREGSEIIHKRVTWDVEGALGDEKKFKSLNIRDQLNSVESELSATQGDVEFLKREHSKVAVTLKKLLERFDLEWWSPREQACAANDMWKHELSKLCEAQEKEVRQCITDVNALVDSSVSELKNWVEVRVTSSEEQKKSDVLGQALQTTELLRGESDKLNSKLEAMTDAVKKDLETLQAQIKQSLEDQGATLKGQMRNQMVIINAEIRYQRNDLEREKNARETGYKHLMSVIEMHRRPAFLSQSQSRSANVTSGPPTSGAPMMDDVAKSVAHLAWQLEAEVADRAKKIQVSKRATTGGISSVPLPFRLDKAHGA